MLIPPGRFVQESIGSSPQPNCLVVFTGYGHVHQPWTIVGSVFSGVFFYTFPTWRFRRTWMSIIVHSAQNVFFAFLVLGIVLGLA
jgi:membrane protease YdiL (CAAX protease family)